MRVIVCRMLAAAVYVLDRSRATLERQYCRCLMLLTSMCPHTTHTIVEYPVGWGSMAVKKCSLCDKELDRWEF